MTPDERLKKLLPLWQSIPITEFGCQEAAFIPWQGKVSALLGFNPKLQTDFQGAANSIEHTLGADTQASIRRANATIRRIIEQAINELQLAVDFPEPPQAPPRPPVLTHEHGIWWFVSNSTVGVRWQLIIALAGICGTSLLVGIGLGQTELIRNLYIQFHNPEIPHTINNSATPERTAQAASDERHENTSNSPARTPAPQIRPSPSPTTSTIEDLDLSLEEVNERFKALGGDRSDERKLVEAFANQRVRWKVKVFVVNYEAMFVIFRTTGGEQCDFVWSADFDAKFRKALLHVSSGSIITIQGVLKPNSDGTGLAVKVEKLE
jgi:hypothetical protein